MGFLRRFGGFRGFQGVLMRVKGFLVVLSGSKVF